MGGSPIARLDARAARRHVIAKRVVALTDRMMRIADARGLVAMLRNAILGLAGGIPAAGRAIASRAADLNLR